MVENAGVLFAFLCSVKNTKKCCPGRIRTIDPGKFLAPKRIFDIEVMISLPSGLEI